MFRRGCRAEGGHRIGDAKLGQGDHIHVAFDDEQTRMLSACLLRLEQSVEFAALVERPGSRASSGI